MANAMHEIVGNVHIHTAYSDGKLYHAALIPPAAAADLDFLVTTDHNVYVRGVEGWKTAAGKSVLLLAGEEIHQQDRRPQKNHLLVFGAHAELCRAAVDPQRLVDAVQAAGGASFLAHPFDPASALIGEGSLSWVSWDVQGFAGIEIWNYMSEFKSLLQSRRSALFHLFLPSFGIRGPAPETLALWDRLLAAGQRVAAIGGSDSHANRYSIGPLRKTVFPHAYLFRAVNMHLLLDTPLTGEADRDGARIIEALRAGAGWVAYDLPKRTNGFRFTAEGNGKHVEMGGEIPFSAAPILRARLPAPAHWKIIRAGSGTVQEGNSDTVEYSPLSPGVYRLEARRAFRGKPRGWIFSNPIYIR
jgi:hypothetical protein